MSEHYAPRETHPRWRCLLPVLWLCLLFACPDSPGPGACQRDGDCAATGTTCEQGKCIARHGRDGRSVRDGVINDIADERRSDTGLVEPPSDEPRLDTSAEPTLEPTRPDASEPVREVRIDRREAIGGVRDVSSEPSVDLPPDVNREAVPEKQPWLPTWQDDPCVGAPSPGYGSTVAKWVLQDKQRMPAQGGIVVTGSSSIRLWKRMQIDLSEWQVIQRGYGGSLLWDAAGNANQIILPYKPRAVLVYAGTNDLSSGRSPDNVLLAYRCLVQRIRKGLGHVHVILIGVTPNPARWGGWLNAVKFNDGVKALAAAWPGLHYIDIATPFLKTGQPPDAKLFVSDRLHLNDDGYKLWTSVIRPALRKIVPPLTYQPPTGQPKVGARALIDLGASDNTNGTHTRSPDVNGNSWNNWHAMSGGQSTIPGEALGLQTTDGQVVPWHLVLGGSFNNNGKQNGGLLSPNAAKLGLFAIATATQDYFYTTAGGAHRAMTLAGLDPAKTYDLQMFASRNTASETRVTEYSVHAGGGKVVKSLTTTGRDIGSDGVYDGNDDTIVTFGALKPTTSGKIHIEVRASRGSYGYLSILSVQVK